MTSLDDQKTLDSKEIRRALRSGDLSAIESLFDQLWYDLPTRFADEIISATTGVSAQELDRRPRLLHATLLAHGQQHFVTGDASLRKLLHHFGTYGRRFAGRLSSYRDPGDLLSAGTLAVISARLRGAYDDSARLGSWVDQQLAVRAGNYTRPWGMTSTARPGWLSTERGVTATLAGDLDRAVHLYSRAHAEAGPAPTEHYAGANAVANLAMLAAFQGHIDLARRWLVTLDEMGGVPYWLEHVSTVGARIARALIAVEEGDAEGASHHLAMVGPATQGIELWPFAAFAHANYDAHFGDPHQGLRRLQEARFVHSAHPLTDGGSIADRLTLRAEAKLLLQTDAGHRVLALAQEHPDADYLEQQVAWVHLLAGHNQQAIRVAAKTLNHMRLSEPDAISVNLVLAIAHLREDNLDRAAHAFETAVRLRSSPALIRPFLSATSEDLEKLSRLARVPNPLTLTRVIVRSNPPSAGSIVRLTRREQEVLEALDRGGTAEQAAAAFGVAVSTVRSQVRSLYKKLGVTKRAAALARAHELGLLSDSRQQRH
ncbi:helix-turn-helix transcriptional regulator [Promicromonospora panici]|uniref:helix-turn-helix transcriptional regulator n=1 Tax=Promicromonospora panici TaxID=2219658 RepID=UPI00101D91EC|nr:helix-turn-helix transcriptional regulator [Promicromonospora panici]